MRVPRKDRDPGQVCVSAEGKPFFVHGVDVWKYEWVVTIRREFAAGEFSNSVFGFYVRPE